MLNTLKALIAQSGQIPESLVRAVVRQSGGWDSFKENAEDMTRSIDGGFHGWIYHTETVKFAKANRAAIASLAESDAESFGTGVLEMVQLFNCIGKDYSQADIAKCLYGRGDDTTIMNGLAWYAAESVARMMED
jgi:hypothetical protein